MDPRAMRDGSEAVCESISEAVNSALEDLRGKASAEAGGYDVESMRNDLESIQERTLDTARTLFGAVNDAMSRLGRSA